MVMIAADIAAAISPYSTAVTHAFVAGKSRNQHFHDPELRPHPLRRS